MASTRVQFNPSTLKAMYNATTSKVMTTVIRLCNESCCDDIATVEFRVDGGNWFSMTKIDTCTWRYVNCVMGSCGYYYVYFCYGVNDEIFLRHVATFDDIEILDESCYVPDSANRCLLSGICDLSEPESGHDTMEFRATFS